MATVTKYKVQSLVGEAEFSTPLPNGKPFKIVFKKEADGKFYAELPEKVTYKDSFNQTHVLHENFAAFFLGAYNDKKDGKNLYNKFRAVKEIKTEEVEVQTVPILDEGIPVIEQEPDAPEPTPTTVDVIFDNPTSEQATQEVVTPKKKGKV